MNALIEDIKDILVEEGVGVFAATSGWGIFIESEPTSNPKSSITLYEVPYRVPVGFVTQNRPPTLYEGVQVRVRAETYLTAYNKCMSAVRVLEKKGTHVRNDSDYAGFHRLTNILKLKQDTKNRFIVVCSLGSIREDISVY